jgi:hypothetical protein
MTRASVPPVAGFWAREPVRRSADWPAAAEARSWAVSQAVRLGLSAVLQLRRNRRLRVTSPAIRRRTPTNPTRPVV